MKVSSSSLHPFQAFSQKQCPDDMRLCNAHITHSNTTQITRKSNNYFSLTRFVDAIDNAVADDEAIAALLIEAQLCALFHRASFAAAQRRDISIL